MAFRYLEPSPVATRVSAHEDFEKGKGTPAFPATGKSFRCRVTVFFLFDGTNLVRERVYFDTATILAQLAT